MVDDPRVTAVLEVLGGSDPGAVARRWAVDPAVLQRWVRAFVDAGAGAVTNRPNPDAARQRDRFLAAFAHELRTPLAVAQGWVAMLEDEELDPMLTRTVERLGEALTRLAERTFDVELLAAASLGLLRLTPRTVTVRELVDGAERRAGRCCTGEPAWTCRSPSTPPCSPGCCATCGTRAGPCPSPGRCGWRSSPCRRGPSFGWSATPTRSTRGCCRRSSSRSTSTTTPPA